MKVHTISACLIYHTQYILQRVWLCSAALPPGTVDFPIKLAENRSLVELVFDGQSVRVLPDTGGANTYALYEDAFGESKCHTFAAGCYSCPDDSCAESSKINRTARFADGTTFTYFRHNADLTTKLGNGTEVKVVGYNLGLVKDYSPENISPHPTVGLRRELKPSRYSFIHQLVGGSAGAIRRLAFSITFPRTSTDVGHLTAGGDPDPDWHAPFVTLHQLDDEGWTLNIDEVGYRSDSGSESVHIDKGRVLFDSGAGVIIGPIKEVGELMNDISKFVHFKGGSPLKIIDCSDISKLPEIWFDIKADDEEGLTTRVFIEGRDYAVPSDNPEECTIDIAGFDLHYSIFPYEWVIGVPLFKGHFVQFTYDVGSIGFAKKKI